MLESLLKLFQSERKGQAHAKPKQVEKITLVERVAKGKRGLRHNSNFNIYFYNFHGSDWKWHIPTNTYIAYKSKPRKLNNGNERYSKFITTTDQYLYEITRSLGESVIGNYSQKKKEMAELIVDFVHHIPYQERNLNYVKYPIETLCEYGGNCADLSILGASMLTIAGIDNCLLVSREHIMLGINIPCEGTYIEKYEKPYYVTEMTGTDWINQKSRSKIGENFEEEIQQFEAIFKNR